MIAYAMIMFGVSALFTILSVQIYKGKTDLIHDYHQTNVKDKAAYGRAFGKALAVLPVGMAASGVVSLFGEKAMWASVAVLGSSLAAGIVAIVLVQKKYNGGMFG